MFSVPLIIWVLSERFLRAGQLRWFHTILSPWPRSEEKCLVRSGLVQLMDRLCSLSSQTESSSSEKQTKKQKVATMAWAAFQVLANRCVEWEKEEGKKQDSFLEHDAFFCRCVCLLFVVDGGKRGYIKLHSPLSLINEWFHESLFTSTVLWKCIATLWRWTVA